MSNANIRRQEVKYVKKNRQIKRERNAIIQIFIDSQIIIHIIITNSHEFSVPQIVINPEILEVIGINSLSLLLKPYLLRLQDFSKFLSFFPSKIQNTIKSYFEIY